MQNQQADTPDSLKSTTMPGPRTLASSLTSDFLRQVTITCRKHGEVAASSVRFQNGEWSTPQCERCRVEEAEAQRALDDQRKADEARHGRQALITQRLEASKIPLRFQSQVFETYMPADEEQRRALASCRAYAEGFSDTLANGRCLILHGTLGTGKTHLACSIIQHIIRAHLRSGLYTSFSRAVRSVKETYGVASDRTEQQAIDAFLRPDLLVVDEVGVQFGTEAEKLCVFR